MNRRTPSASPWISAAALVAVLAVAARSADEPTRPALTAADLPAPRVDWYGMYVQTTKVGWMRIELSKTADAFVMSPSLSMDLKAMGKPFKMEMSERDEFDGIAPFALRGARSESKQNGVSQTVELTRTKDGFSAVVTQAGQTHSPPVPALDYTLADALGAELWFRTPRAIGDTVRFRSFSLTKVQADVDTDVVKGRKESVVEGVPTVFYDVWTSSEKSGVTGTGRFDGHGKLLSMVIGEAFEARLEPEDVAKRTEQCADLFVFGMAKIDQPIGAVRSVDRLILGVDGAGAAHLADAPRQSVLRDEKTGEVTLVIGAEVPKAAAAAPNDAEAALAETVVLPTKSPQVVALAREAVGDAKTPQEKVDRIVHFVAKYVEDALCPGTMSVAEIISKKKGDCTEHARLFAALARAAGVPAREVIGLMYMGDDVKAFGGHAWDEVVLDGKWVPVDPTWDETLADAAHVTTKRDGSGTSSLDTFGAISFRLKSVQHKP